MSRSHPGAAFFEIDRYVSRSLGPLLTLTLIAAVAGTGYAASAPPGPPLPSAAATLPGREEDGRIADIAYRLATRGSARCPNHVPAYGIVFQHLSQFAPTDRAAIVAANRLDRGPGVIVVVRGSPGDRATLRPGDVTTAIGGVALPPEPLQPRFAADIAHARADRIGDLLSVSTPATVTVLRGKEPPRSVVLQAVPACPSRVHLARSQQRNAYADGRHVFVTTALLAGASDDEAAFVIAHEMAHNILGHAAVMRGGVVRRGLGRTLGHSGRIVREAERAADALGGELMLDAGYDPVRGAGILRRLGGGPRIGLFTAYASANDRIAAMRTLVEARRPR